MNQRRHILWLVISLFISLLVGCGAVSEDDAQTEPEVVETYAQKQLEDTAWKNNLAVFFLRGDVEYADYDTQTMGAGQSILMIAPDGSAMLVDFNGMINGAYTAQVLSDLGIKELSCAVLTSWGISYTGGMPAVLRNIAVEKLYTCPLNESNIAGYANGQYLVQEHQLELVVLQGGEMFQLGSDVHIEVLNPAQGMDYEALEKNLLLKITYGESSFLIGGQISAATEKALVEQWGTELCADVVNMNNCGSQGSGVKEWVSTIGAKAVIGQSNIVQSDSVMGRWMLSGADVFHTAIDGTVLVTTAGDGTYGIQVEYSRMSEEYPMPEMADGYTVIG